MPCCSIAAACSALSARRGGRRGPSDGASSRGRSSSPESQWSKCRVPHVPGRAASQPSRRSRPARRHAWPVPPQAIEARLVRKRDRRPQAGTRSVIRYFLCVVQLERRNCQATSPPIAATSPESQLSRRNRLAVTVDHQAFLDTEVRATDWKFHGGAPAERRIAPSPSAVMVGSTPGARWKRMA